MAYYGIPSAGLALTASIGNDSLTMAGSNSTTLTGISLYGADGNDLINLGPIGRSAAASATYSGTLSAGGSSVGEIAGQ